MNFLVELQSLKKSYRKKVVFSNLNLQIKEGDRIALMGRNGVGKTTLIEMICGLQSITEGKIKFANREKFFESLGIQFQTGNYPGGIRVKDLIWLYMNIYQKSLDLKLKKRFKIGEIENQKVNTLSYGQRKRLELFLLISSHNRILILDEITIGMDIEIRLDVTKYLQQYIKENKVTLIYVAHNFQEIYQLCDRIVMIGKHGILMNKKIVPGNKFEKEVQDTIHLQAREEKNA